MEINKTKSIKIAYVMKPAVDDSEYSRFSKCVLELDFGLEEMKVRVSSEVGGTENGYLTYRWKPSYEGETFCGFLEKATLKDFYNKLSPEYDGPKSMLAAFLNILVGDIQPQFAEEFGIMMNEDKGSADAPAEEAVKEEAVKEEAAMPAPEVSVQEPEAIHQISEKEPQHDEEAVEAGIEEEPLQEVVAEGTDEIIEEKTEEIIEENNTEEFLDEEEFLEENVQEAPIQQEPEKEDITLREDFLWNKEIKVTVINCAGSKNEYQWGTGRDMYELINTYDETKAWDVPMLDNEVEDVFINGENVSRYKYLEEIYKDLLRYKRYAV